MMTETMVRYIVQPPYTSLDQIKTLPLADLRTLKRDWLDVNRPFIENDLTLVTQYLGELTLGRGRYYMLFETGKISVKYVILSGGYDLYVKDYIDIHAIYAYYGARKNENMICRHKVTNFGKYPEDEQSFIVPGQWQDTIRSFVDRAIAERDRQTRQQEELERKELLSELRSDLWGKI